VSSGPHPRTGMSRDRSTKPFPSLHPMNSVLNTSRPGIYVKQATAKALVEQCAAEWVIEGMSIRELEAKERLERIRVNLETRGSVFTHFGAKSTRDSYLPPIEPTGCKFVPPISSNTSKSLIRELVVAARQFCEQVSQ
jgi:hypothetical protein